MAEILYKSVNGVRIPLNEEDMAQRAIDEEIHIKNQAIKKSKDRKLEALKYRLALTDEELELLRKH